MQLLARGSLNSDLPLIVIEDRQAHVDGDTDTMYALRITLARDAHTERRELP